MTKLPALRKMRFWSLLLLGTLAVVLAGVNEARAAIVAAGATCSNNGPTSGTTLSCTVATEAFDVNNVAVLWFAGDDAATADTVNHNNLLLTSVTDNAPTPNIWTVQRCFTNTEATSAANGATVCVATARITSAIPVGGTITATFGTTTAKAIVVREFTVAAGNALDVAGTATDLENDGLDPGPMTISGLTSGEYLFVRATASERDAITWTLTTNYTSSTCATTAGGGAAANMNICGEFRILTGTGDTSDPTGANVDSASIFIAFKEKASTTIATGNDPGAGIIVGPDTGAQVARDVNYFTFLTSSGPESITSVTVNLSTHVGIATLAITDNADAVLGSIPSPSIVTGSNTISVSGLSAGTTQTTFKVRVTPLSHVLMPVVPGGLYAITAPVTAWAGPNAHVGSDTNPNALTIDNLSSGDVTGATGTAGNAQVVLNWTNPADTSTAFILVLRDTTAVVTPVEGVVPYAGSSTVVCTITSPTPSAAANCTDTGVTNGNTYHYKIFTRDSIGNYSTGVVPTGSPYLPSGPGCYAKAGGGIWKNASTWAGAADGTGTCPGTALGVGVPDSGTPVYITLTTAVTVTIDATPAEAASVTLTAPSSGTSILGIDAGTLTVGGSVTITGGSGGKESELRFTMGTLKVGGTITDTVTPTLTWGTGTVEYNGGGAQTVGTYSYYNLTINKSAGTATTAANITVSNNLTVSQGTLNLGANNANGGGTGTLSLGSGATMKIAQGNYFPSGYALVSLNPNSTVEYNATFPQTVAIKAYGHLKLSGTDNKFLSPGGGTTTLTGNLTTTDTAIAEASGNLTVQGNLSFGANTSFTPNAYTVTMSGGSAQSIGGGVASIQFHHLTINNSITSVTANVNLLIKGNFTNTAGFSAGTTTTTFNGTAAQTLTGATMFNNLTMNNTSTGLTINNDVTVNSTMTFTAGNVTTGTGNTLIIGSSGSVSRTSGHVVGRLRKYFPTGSSISREFEIGEGTNYLPVSIPSASVSAAGYLTVYMTAGDHPNLGGSGSNIDPTKSVNRYWTLTKEGALAFSSYNTTFNYLSTDNDDTTVVLDYIVQRYLSGTWSNTTLTTPDPSTTQTSISGESGDGAFAIGRSTVAAFERENEFVYSRELSY